MLLRVSATSLVAGVLALSYFVVQPSAQHAPTFRSSVQIIEVDATVSDQRGKFVAGLTRDDFEVLEDGVRQNLESFTVSIPQRRLSESKGDRAAMTGSGPGTSGADAAPGAATGQRTDYVLIFNAAERLAYARQQKVARTFIRTAVAPGDRVAIVETALGLPPDLPFLTGRQEMLKAVDGVSGLLCRVDAKSFWMIRDVVSRLARVQGARKEVIFLSEGTPYLWHGQIGYVPAADLIDVVKANRRAFEEAMRMATIARIPVHTVDPGGLKAPQSTSSTLRAGRYSGGPPYVPAFDDLPYQRELDIRTNKIFAPEPAWQLAAETSSNDRLSMMRLVAEVTGGRDVVNTNSFEKNFRGIVEDRPASYLLSYSSPANQRDGRFHTIEVRVKRPGLKVRSRKGYYAFRPGGSVTPAVPIPDTVSPQARALIEAESPTADVDATARAASLSVGLPEGSVMVGLQVKNATTAFDASKPIEIVWTAVSDDGYGALTAVERRSVHLTTPSSGAPAVVAFDQLKLPEGQYLITGIASQQGGRTAMARTQVNVESRPSAPYGFTDVILASSAADDRQIVHEDKEVMRLLPYPPAVEQKFARRETLALYTEFHDVSESFEKVVLRLTVSSPRDGVKIRTDKTMTFKTANPEAAQLNPWMTINGRRFTYANSIQLAGFEPGAYTMKIEAVGSGTLEATVSREVGFTVY